MEKNSVTITGYLKENTLETFVNKKGQNAIRGNLIIATSSLENHRIQFIGVSEFTNAGAESKEYKNLLAMLPENTVSIASYLNANPDADFETAAKASSKVWAFGYFDEFARKTETGEEISTVQIKGRRAGFSKSADKDDFTTKAVFEVEIYIADLAPEKDSTGAETGRYKLTGLLQNYDQSVTKVDFIAPTQDGVADYIVNNYKISDTVHINGNLINLMTKVLVKSANEGHFGAGGRDQYKTTFTNERIITGGDEKATHEGAEGCISNTAVKIGLAKRENKIAENSKYSKSSSSSDSTLPKANFGKSTTTSTEDIDF